MEMKWKEKYTAAQEPSLEEIGAFIGSPLWEELRAWLEEEFKTQPKVEYSQCSMKAGWNVKYKKSGKSLCTLYPDQGFFTCLVTVGRKEAQEAELLLCACTPYTQRVYSEAGALNGSRWLMLDVTEKAVLEDVKELISLRVPGRKKN